MGIIFRLIKQPYIQNICSKAHTFERKVLEEWFHEKFLLYHLVSNNKTVKLTELKWRFYSVRVLRSL